VLGYYIINIIIIINVSAWRQIFVDLHCFRIKSNKYYVMVKSNSISGE